MFEHDAIAIGLGWQPAGVTGEEVVGQRRHAVVADDHGVGIAERNRKRCRRRPHSEPGERREPRNRIGGRHRGGFFQTVGATSCNVDGIGPSSFDTDFVHGRVRHSGDDCGVWWKHQLARPGRWFTPSMTHLDPALDRAAARHSLTDDHEKQLLPDHTNRSQSKTAMLAPESGHSVVERRIESGQVVVGAKPLRKAIE